MTFVGTAPLALTTDERVIWYVALAIGVVVIIAVIALLSLLMALVGDIDVGVQNVWRSAKRLAGNTATTWQVGGLAAVLKDVRAEVVRHDQLLKDQL